MAEYDYFFRRKKTRLGEFSHRRVQRALSRSLSGYLGGRKRILEIGCGDGYFAEDCRERGLRWVGAEANRGQCRVLARRGFPVVGASVPPLPFRSRSFDVIYCSHLLEHIEQQDARGLLLDEIADVLKDDGVFILVAPNADRWGREFWNVDYTHHFVTTSRRINQLLSDHQFEVIKVEGMSGTARGWTRHIMNALMSVYPARLLDRMFGSLLSPDLFYNMKVTLLENVITVSRKRTG